MTPAPDLSKLTSQEKDALILALIARIDELEARLGGPPKTPGNSSVPPSSGHKRNKPGRSRGMRREASVGRMGGGRRPHPTPDRIVTAKAAYCPHCAAAVDAGEQRPRAVYDRIELPVVRPDVTRIEQYGGDCRCCGRSYLAPAPQGLEPGSPFGRSVTAMAIYLRYGHAIAYERLSGLFAHLFGLAISEGALANLFRRAQPAFAAQTPAILADLRASPVVGSDETSARVEGRNHWEWVFHGARSALHVIRPSRAAAVVAEVMAGHRPAVWVADLYSAQHGHGEQAQICLAHQFRDCQYAIDAGDAIFAPAMKLLLHEAVVLSYRRDRLGDSTLKQYRATLERRLTKLIALKPLKRDGQRLRQRYAKERAGLFTFVTDRRVPPTNNASERELRPSVIFRKVTNGFRSQWGADLFAEIRSVVATGARNAQNPFAAVNTALSGSPILKPG
jgi:transposase